MSAFRYNFSLQGEQEKLDSATNPTRLVQDVDPSIFIPNIQPVTHNFRNLPPAFLLVRHSLQISWLDVTAVLGKLKCMKFCSPPSKASLQAEYNFSMEMADQLHLSVLNLQANQCRWIAQKVGVGSWFITLSPHFRNKWRTSFSKKRVIQWHLKAIFSCSLWTEMQEEKGKIAFTWLTLFAFSRAPGTLLRGELYKKKLPHLE